MNTINLEKTFCFDLLNHIIIHYHRILVRRRKSEELRYPTKISTFYKFHAKINSKESKTNNNHLEEKLDA